MRWRLALENDVILSPESTELLFAPLVSEGRFTSSSYSYGWAVFNAADGGTITGHSGATDASNSSLQYHAERRTLVVALSNVIDLAYRFPFEFEVFYAEQTVDAVLAAIVRGDFREYPSYARQFDVPGSYHNAHR